MAPSIICNTPQGIAEAARLLREDNLVAIPTETVYGLAANALSAGACAKIFALKQRPASDPLIVHIHATPQLSAVACIPDDSMPIVDALAASFWPGPLTMVFPAHPSIPSLVTAGGHTVGVRMPRHPVARAILECSGLPLAAPSANVFGSISPTSSADVMHDFPDSDLAVVDGGDCDVGIESTVVLVESTFLTVLRRGQVTEDMLEDTLIKHGLSHVEIRVRALSVSTIQENTLSSPGQYIRHYSPRAPSYLLTSSEPALPGAVRVGLPEPSKGLLVVVDCNPRNAERADADYSSCIDWPSTNLSHSVQVIRAYSEPTAEATARGVFSALRRADALCPRCILLVPPEGAAGLPGAVLDRLFRAASGRWIRASK